MALKDKREEAEKLYVRGQSCREIADALEVNEGTVYRWKADAAEKGEAFDWDAQRRVYNISPSEMFAIYAETVKTWLAQINRTPELLSDGKIADAIVKHVSVLEKLDKRSRYMGVVLDLVKVLNRWLSENHPDIKEKLEPHWESVYRELEKYATGKGLF